MASENIVPGALRALMTGRSLGKTLFNSAQRGVAEGLQSVASAAGLAGSQPAQRAATWIADRTAQAFPRQSPNLLYGPNSLLNRPQLAPRATTALSVAETAGESIPALLATASGFRAPKVTPGIGAPFMNYLKAIAPAAATEAGQNYVQDVVNTRHKAMLTGAGLNGF